MIDKLNTHYSMTNPASVYDEESLTALELAGRTTAKVNEVVDAQNGLQQNVTNTLNEQNQNIENIRTVTVPEDVSKEVQKQIDNGTFDNAIDTYAGELETRVNNLLGSVTQGTTTMDAEVIDARVGDDGVSYSTLGGAIRKQFNQKYGCNGLRVTSSNYTSILTDANDAPLNESVFIDFEITENHIANLPIYNLYGLLMTFTFSPDSPHGCVQLYFTKSGGFWRFELAGVNGQDSWGEWHSFMDGEIENSLFKSSNIFIDAQNTTLPFTNANNAPTNKAFFISSTITAAHITNLPLYDNYGILFSMVYSGYAKHGLAQFYLSGKRLFYRFEQGNDANPVWSPWESLTSDTNFATGKTSDVKLNVNYSTCEITISSSSGYIWSPKHYVYVGGLTNKSVVLPENSGGQTSFIYIRDNALMVEDMTKYKGMFDDIIIGQIYHARTTIHTIIWLLGFDEDKHTISSPINDMTCSIFNRVCCVGDSYTSGHIQTPDGSAVITNEKYAYPSYMAKLTGCEYVNCGSSGANVWTWQTVERGLPKAQQTGKVQAYLIGLGLNDTASGTARFVELGTTADIGTENQTYYAGLSKIIRELKTISPDAHVFVQTIPNPSTLQSQYNEAIRNVVSAYAVTYNTHLLDLANYGDMYKISSVQGNAMGGHYTASGYQQVANILTKVWSEYINNNISKFQNVHLIEYDEV